MPKDIPGIAWVITSVSGLTLSFGVCVSTIRSSSLSVEVADVKIETTAKLSKLVELSKELEQKANALQEKEEAYGKLKIEYDNLLEHNQPIKLLEPAIQEVDRVNSKNEIERLEKEIEETAQAASEKIAEIAESKPSEEKEIAQDDETEQQ